ncbi:MAG: SigE family RNA polymerase sigma factor [Actinomycetota bacterium]
MPDDARDAAFRAFVQANGQVLLHAARLLTGDHHRGEDLVQSTLTKLYTKWDRVSEPLAYARKTLVTGHIDSARRRWWGERPAAVLPEAAADDVSLTASEGRDELRRMLRELDARERAVIVLRYYCDLSEADTAESLGMPLGTVKSSCARALARLRVEATATAGGEW